MFILENNEMLLENNENAQWFINTIQFDFQKNKHLMIKSSNMADEQKIGIPINKLSCGIFMTVQDGFPFPCTILSLQ